MTLLITETPIIPSSSPHPLTDSTTGTRHILSDIIQLALQQFILYYIQSRPSTTWIHIRTRRVCTSYLVFFTTVHMYFAYLAQEMLRIASVNGDDCLRSWNGVYIWFAAYWLDKLFGASCGEAYCTAVH